MPMTFKVTFDHLELFSYFGIAGITQHLSLASVGKGGIVHRRDFCKLLAIAAASKAVPSTGQTTQESQPVLPSWI